MNPIQQEPTVAQRLRSLTASSFLRLTYALAAGGLGAMLLGELFELDFLSQLGIWAFLAAFVTATLYKIANLMEGWAALGRGEAPQDEVLEQREDR